MLRCVRTTLTLDPDVAIQLERIRKRRGVPLKRVVNDALREGLSRLDEPEPTERFRTRTVSLGGLRVPNLDDISAVLEFGEDERLK
jgi:hypothetical protein